MLSFEDQAERRRLDVLASYHILNTLPEAEYDALTRLASQICQTPISLISLLDADRQWYKSARGLPQTQNPRQGAFCNLVLENRSMLVVPDARKDPRFIGNPFTTGKYPVVFYAGAPLVTPEGEILGTLCVIDQQPHVLAPEQREALETLAGQVVTLLELRRSQALSVLRQQQLGATNQLLQAVVDAMPTGLVLWEAIRDPQGQVQDFRYVLTNPANASVTHRGVDEMTGRTLLELFPDSRTLGVFNQLVTVTESGQSLPFRQHYQGDGIDAYIEGILQPVGPNSVLFTFRDVTDQMRQNQELVQARKSAEEALRVRDTFLVNVSHDLRTPLNSILGFSELLSSSVQTSPESDYVRNIHTAGRNLLQLINSLLDMAKLDSGQLELEKAPASLMEVLETVRSLMAVQASRKDLQFVLQPDPNLPGRVETDSLRLTQILLNLCGNAVKFTAQGCVSLEASVESRTAEAVRVGFRVVDTGIGIPADRLGHIFERYTQTSASVARHYGGTGLGLNIVRSLVEQLNGTISVESQPGRGTTMTVCLPFRVLADPAPAPVQPSTRPGGLSSDLKILLVEDNVFNQKLVSGILAGYKIRPHIVNNGLEALQALRRETPDVVLLDIQMPLMDGYQTARHIRQTLGLPLPIIALTANAMASEREACLREGMDDYLSKPFTKAQLVAKLEHWKESSRAENGQPGRFGDRIDQHQLRDTFAGITEILPDLLESFVSGWPGEVKALTALLESDQQGPFRQEAHHLRSSLYALCMNRSAELLKRLEWEYETFTADQRQQLLVDFTNLTEESITGLGQLLEAGLL